MITKELLKREIDNVQDEYLTPLYKIIKTFEYPDDLDNIEFEDEEDDHKKKDWLKFIDKFAGCLSDTPIERRDQGYFETREEII
ncbi:MAG: hypothetical protein NT166_18630 [Candidatus Aminicenantes bacterium]|nr:hypothetical protein [Candidatus Aminicenantes bacterium]